MLDRRKLAEVANENDVRIGEARRDPERGNRASTLVKDDRVETLFLNRLALVSARERCGDGSASLTTSSSTAAARPGSPPAVGRSRGSGRSAWCSAATPPRRCDDYLPRRNARAFDSSRTSSAPPPRTVSVSSRAAASRKSSPFSRSAAGQNAACATGCRCLLPCQRNFALECLGLLDLLLRGQLPGGYELARGSPSSSRSLGEAPTDAARARPHRRMALADQRQARESNGVFSDSRLELMDRRLARPVCPACKCMPVPQCRNQPLLLLRFR